MQHTKEGGRGHYSGATKYSSLSLHEIIMLLFLHINTRVKCFFVSTECVIGKKQNKKSVCREREREYTKHKLYDATSFVANDVVCWPEEEGQPTTICQDEGQRHEKKQHDFFFFFFFPKRNEHASASWTYPRSTNCHHHHIPHRQHSSHI